MADLIAQGPDRSDRWRREIPDFLSGNQIVIGRNDGDWIVPWDPLVSRRHVRLIPQAADRVQVQSLPESRNPVFHRGEQSTEFLLVPGEHFVIGQTTFTLAKRPGASHAPAAAEVTEHAYDLAILRRKDFRDAAARIEVLSRLPDLIASSSSDEELLVRVSSVLLQSTPSAAAVAIVAAGDSESAPLQILHYDTRVPGSEGPTVSTRLVRSTIEKRASTLHLWAESRADSVAYTASEDVDWAFCVPLRSEACPGWALYVTGQLGAQAGTDLGQSLRAAPADLQDDVKFAELVGSMVANLRQSHRLQRRQAAIRQFFAPVVMDALAGRDTEQVLEPREADLSVLFCDLRGFSQRSERDADQLLKLLEHVSDAMGVMTRHILGTGGVIGDFHGDAAMGFWGWPLDQADSASRAAEAAMQIRNENIASFETTGFRCGIGIASGRAVAGRIGTVDQVKVTAFGPVVNLASRLEGMTKAFGAEVILDDATAAYLRERHAATALMYRVRRLALVRPSGLSTPVEISELLPPYDEHANSLTDQQIVQYERALDCVLDGDWDEAFEILQTLPSWDRPRDVLLSTMRSHDRVKPDRWTGVISLPKL
jgi:adenylate cyclase